MIPFYELKIGDLLVIDDTLLAIPGMYIVLEIYVLDKNQRYDYQVRCYSQNQGYETWLNPFMGFYRAS